MKPLLLESLIPRPLSYSFQKARRAWYIISCGIGSLVVACEAGTQYNSKNKATR